MKKTLEVFPDTKIIISLAILRKDKEEWNIKGELTNALIKKKFRENNTIIICDNSNLAVNGKPKTNVIKADGIHLSKEGVAILVSNIKQSLDKTCNTQRRTNTGSRGGSRQNNYYNTNRSRQNNSGNGGYYYQQDYYNGYYPGRGNVCGRRGKRW